MGARLPSWLNVNDSAYPPGILSSLVTMYIKRPAAQSRSERHPTLQSQTHPKHKSLGFRAPGFVPHQSEVSRGGAGVARRTELQRPRLLLLAHAANITLLVIYHFMKNENTW